MGALFATLLLVRTPYLVAWWPGIVPFDTFRSFSYVRGVGEWEQYEPVAHSLLVGAMQALGGALGGGDAGIVAFGATVQLLTSSAASAFLLWRMAVWGVGTRAWAVSFLWLAASPVLGIFSITVVKDMPFTTAFVVFVTCVGELTIGRQREGGGAWAWAALIVSGAATSVLRNNGVYVVLAGIAILIGLVWRRVWRRAAAVLAVIAVVYAAYAGPLTSALDAAPVPPAEAWSVPLQQLARIAATEDLDAQDRRFLDELFPENGAEGIGDVYDPFISDPVKADAHAGWSAIGTGEFLLSWARIAAAHPGRAIEATLAGTVGYWAPGAASYDGLILSSHNDVRDVHLDIDARPPQTGLGGFLVRHELLGDTLRAIPLLGLTITPATVVWAWIIAAVVIIRCRGRQQGAVLVPAAILLATILAGPVSGGMRYILPLAAALPVAIGAASAAVRSEPSRQGAHRDEQ
ncbi:DUF6020 family protein [Microbacterium sp. NPDC055683]